MINSFVIFAISSLFYCISTGILEGYAHTTSENKLLNSLISPTIIEGKGILGYHVWRTIELFSTLGLIIVFTGHIYYFLWILVFFPVYEFFLVFVNRYGKYTILELIKLQKVEWSFQGFNIIRFPWYIKYYVSLISFITLIFIEKIL
jgi:hypothetical protein